MRCAVLLALLPLSAIAHDAADEGLRLSQWEPWITGPLLLALSIYARGAGRLWRRANRRLSLWRAACFLGGSAVLLGNLISPIHTLADRWFFVHMGEHELLMMVAAPLFALSRPLPVLLWGLPARVRRGVTRAAGPFRGTWRFLSRPFVATTVHGLAIWVWHIPRLFDFALRQEGMHALQHLSFLLSALLFWSVLLHGRRHERAGAAVLCLFFTAVHTSLLGALLAFSQRLWYAQPNGAGNGWSLTPIEDQQLAGILMWVPGGAIYAIAAVALLGLWLWRSEEGTWEKRHAPASQG